MTPADFTRHISGVHLGLLIVSEEVVMQVCLATREV